MRQIEILLVEDSPADIRLAQETMREHNFINQVHIVGDGEAALAYLRREPPYVQATKPDLILLDMDLPKLDGVEVMRELAKSPGLSDIPLVVLAASTFDKELIADFNLEPDCFIIKPLLVQQWLQALKCFPHLGLSIVSAAAAVGDKG